MRHLGGLPRADELAVALRDPNEPPTVLEAVAPTETTSTESEVAATENTVTSDEAAATTSGAAGTVAAMRAAGEPKASVAARLGITGAELKKLLDQAPAATGPAASEQSEAAAEVQEETVAEAA